MRTLLILRSHRADADTLAAYDRYAALRTVDVVLCCDERDGPVDMGERAKIGFDTARLTGLGLFPHPRCGWRCGDYAYYVTRTERPDYDVYWLTEPDVLLNTADLPEFFDRLNATDADLLAARIGPRDDVWKWGSMMRSRYPDVYGCIFPVTRLSRRAIDHLHAARRAAWGPETEAASEAWPNDEVFVVTELMNHGFACRDLAVQSPGCTTRDSIRTAIPHDRAALQAAAPDGLIYHPVRDFAAWLDERSAWAADAGRRSRGTVDGLESTDVRHLLGMATGALEHASLQNAAFFPLMLARGAAPATRLDTPLPVSGRVDYQGRAARTLAKHFGPRGQGRVFATGYRLAAADGSDVLPVPGGDDFLLSDAVPLHRLPGDYALPYAFDAGARTLLYTVHPRPHSVLSASSALAEQRRQACIGCVVEWRHLARFAPEGAPAALLALAEADIPAAVHRLKERGLRPIVDPPALLQLVAMGASIRLLREDWRAAMIRAAVTPAGFRAGWVFVLPLDVLDIGNLLIAALPGIRIESEANRV